MGSWNGSCLFSGLSIGWYQPVKAILMTCKGEVTGVGYCEADDLFVPTGLPITGIYNTYGTLEKIKDDRESQATWAFLKDKIKGIGKDYVQPANLEDLLKMVERGYAGWSYSSEEVQKLGLALVHEDVWVDTLKFAKSFKHWSDNTFEEFIEEKIARDEAFEKSYADEESPFREFGEVKIKSSLGLWKHPICGASRQDLIDYAVIKEFFRATGKKWDIQNNCGSQDDYWDLNSKYHNYVSEFSSKLYKEQCEECEV